MVFLFFVFFVFFFLRYGFPVSGCPGTHSVLALNSDIRMPLPPKCWRIEVFDRKKKRGGVSGSWSVACLSLPTHPLGTVRLKACKHFHTQLPFSLLKPWKVFAPAGLFLIPCSVTPLHIDLAKMEGYTWVAAISSADRPHQDGGGQPCDLLFQVAFCFSFYQPLGGPVCTCRTVRRLPKADRSLLTSTQAQFFSCFCSILLNARL